MNSPAKGSRPRCVPPWPLLLESNTSEVALETHCYGLLGCPHYKASPTYRVPGRSLGILYVDDGVEREARGE
jgi:hypothetical protein